VGYADLPPLWYQVGMAELDKNAISEHILGMVPHHKKYGGDKTFLLFTKQFDRYLKKD